MTHGDGVERIAEAFAGARADGRRAALMPYLMGGFPDLDTSRAIAVAYADAGADLIFPEAMADEADFERFRAAIDTPILANMTEFGKSKLLDAKTLQNLGVNIVIYPVTLLRLAMHAAGVGLAEIAGRGTQDGLLDQMQHRRDLYDLLDYEAYNSFDTSVFNFTL